MSIILGIESTAHTFGIGVVENGKVLSNVKHTYTTDSGGIIPLEAAKHHENHKYEIYAEAIKCLGHPKVSNKQKLQDFEALTQAKINENKIDAIAFSNAPGLAPCLIEGMKFAKELSLKLKKPLVSVNHCIAHLEIGRLTKAKDPVMLYCSGANTQIIAYASGKYRIFGETLDIGVGNFIDNFARYAGIGFPGGPVIQKLAESKNCKYIELPYTVKGMDVAFSGILTNLKQKLEKMDLDDKKIASHNGSKIDNKLLIKKSEVNDINNKLGDNKSNYSEVNYTLSDLAYSLQETVFAMLVETAERALAHTGKKELLLGGGVACNKRLQEMCKIMCKERKAKLFVPENSLLIDNGAMIAFLGEIMFKSGIKLKADDVDIKPRQRTDEVIVSWKI